MGNGCIEKRIFRLSLLAIAWLLAGASFAKDEFQAELSVNVDKSPRKKIYTREYIDDQEIDTEKDIDRYITYETYTLDMTVSNDAEQEGVCVLEWYFIAAKIKGEDGAWTDELQVFGN